MQSFQCTAICLPAKYSLTEVQFCIHYPSPNPLPTARGSPVTRYASSAVAQIATSRLQFLALLASLDLIRSCFTHSTDTFSPTKLNVLAQTPKYLDPSFVNLRQKMCDSIKSIMRQVKAFDRFCLRCLCAIAVGAERIAPSSSSLPSPSPTPLPFISLQ